MAGLMCKIEDPTFQYINTVEDAIFTMELVEKCYQCNDGISQCLINEDMSYIVFLMNLKE